MPNNIAHDEFCRLLGLNPKKSTKINKFIDSPIAFFGKNHRKVMHDDMSGLALSFMTKDPETFLIHKAHTMLDEKPWLLKAMKLIK